MNNRLTKGIIIVFITNVINVIFTLFTGFALPKWLSDEAYAAIRTYQLYISYVGVLHFGYVDGVYLKYGGKELCSIQDDELSEQRGSLLAMQFLISLALIPACFLLQDIAIIALCLTVVPYNMTQYYKMLYQATGEFASYGRTENLSTILLFCVNSFLLLVCRQQEHSFYLIGYVIAYCAVWIFSEWQFSRKKNRCRKPKYSFHSIVENVKNGCLLMLGNFSSIMLTSIDRWFVKLLLNTVAFARYSFAVSVEGMLNVVVTPVSTALYNYFCSDTDPNQLRKALDNIILFAVWIVAAIFPARLIIEWFLPRYNDSVDVMLFLFAGQIFFVIVKCMYVNLYKARQAQRSYFIKLTIVILAGVALNIICFRLLHQKEAFSIGTFLSAVLWFVLCLRDFPDMRPSLRQYVYLFAETVFFFSCGKMPAAWGLCLYIAGSLGITLILMRQAFWRFIQIPMQLLNHTILHREDVADEDRKA